jgi:nucleoside-diphosphate-sugar epimerase
MEAVSRVAIIGAAGAIGVSAASAFDERQISYRVVGRNRARLETLFAGRAEIASADMGDASQAEKVLEGVDTVLYTVGLPYPEFRRHPLLMRSALDAARRAGVKRAGVVSSVYSYGVPRTARVAETHPREPESRKGQHRKEQEDIALQAHSESLGTFVLRLPDFYGPHAENSLADMMFRAALDGKTATWLGDPDLPHEFIFVPDAGPVIVDLLHNDSSFGQAWNLAGAGTITGREFITAVHSAAGRTPKLRSVGSAMLRVGGVFSPMLRELVELRYLGYTPVILDDTKLHKHLGSVRKTPYDAGIARTLEWYRQRAVAREL